jgi:NAD(P)-dependent dehydrogenase (short-subunit alcohol dehydrogenase family)
MKDGFASIIPMVRIGKPREIATAALFLASDDSDFVTGIETMVRHYALGVLEVATVRYFLIVV